jgi:hypothetical protein
VAVPDNTIDPNDLDSIDALLDEAELEQERPQVDLPDLDEAPAEAIDIPIEQDKPDDDELERLLDSAIDTPSTDPLLDDAAEMNATPEPATAMNMAPPSAEQRLQEQQELDAFLSRREQSATNLNELSVAEMDTLKNLIIGFGSALIVLALIAIGMATWAALSAGSADVDPKLVEEIRGEVEVGRMSSQANQESMRELSKKLDALSFQLEQVNGDIVALTNTTLPQASLSGAQNLPEVMIPAPVPAPAPVAAPVAAAAPAPAEMGRLEDKVDAVNRSLAVAQRRVVEINNRVKSLQKQYETIVSSLKVAEKNALQTQVEQLNEQAKPATKPAQQPPTAAPSSSNTDRYRYAAPSGGFYEPGNTNSYP